MMQQLPISFTSYSTHQIQNGPLGEYECKKPTDKGEDMDLLGLVSWQDIYSSCTQNDQPPPPKSSISNCNTMNNYQFSNASFSSGDIQETEVRDTQLPETPIFYEILKQHRTSDLDSLDLLRNYESGFTKSNREKKEKDENEIGYGEQKISTEEIIRMGGQRYIECAIQGVDHNLMYMHPYGASFSGLSIEEIRDVDLGHFLLAAAEKEIPFNQVTVFTGIQAMLERAEKEKNIHLIDFQIRSGVQWTAFIQDLAQRNSNRVQRLKITAIALSDTQKVKETGKQLEAFAKSLNMPFSYSVITVSDMQDLRKEHFQIKTREAVVVYCPVILRTMISRPYCLQHVMRVIKKLNPAMMVVTEVEANLNSPSFFNRFIETLFFYSAYFDCLEDSSDRDNHYRTILERIFFGDGINNIVAAEGDEWFTRSVKMNVWGTFFQKFGMVPVEISESSLYRANLLMDQFACKNSCNIEKRGNCLTVGWKKTPIQTVSVWRFC